MLRVLGYAGSINVRKVLWTCEELGAEYRREDWGGGTRPVSDPEFLALNPAGMVPVLVDGDAVVWESNAIIRYLAASRGRTDLLPDDPLARAQIEKWMDWQVSDFNNSWRPAFMGLVRRNPDFQDPARIRRSIDEFARMVKVVDAELEKTGAYIAGSDFTLADIVIGLSVHRWRCLPADKPTFKNIDRYYAALCERPSFERFGLNGGP